MPRKDYFYFGTKYFADIEHIEKKWFKISYFETSAVTGHNIDESFEVLYHNIKSGLDSGIMGNNKISK